jgi:signal transduction histidine kinase
MAGFLYYGEVLLRLLPEKDYALRLEALAEALPLEVAATDAGGRVIVWNAALAAVAGPRDRAVGRPLLDALPGLAADPNLDWAAALDDVLAGGPGIDVARHPLGARVVRATLAPMRGRRADLLGAVLCFEDITGVTRDEERRRLRARADAVTALGAGIAHEIRNPLNALSLQLQLLREQLQSPERRPAALVEKADAMIAELRRVDTLVQDLLEVSRGGPPVTEPVAVDGVVEEALERLAPHARSVGASTSFAPASRRTLPLERARIYRALHNIVENAIDAAGSGGHVWITTRDDPHSTVVVVDDDGPGIPPAERRRIFELFYTTKRGGTGLGLALAHRAVESHGGEVEVLDRPGGGARFVVHLPLGEEHGGRRKESPAWRGS